MRRAGWGRADAGVSEGRAYATDIQTMRAGYWLPMIGLSTGNRLRAASHRSQNQTIFRADAGIDFAWVSATGTARFTGIPMSASLQTGLLAGHSPHSICSDIINAYQPFTDLATSRRPPPLRRCDKPVDLFLGFHRLGILCGVGGTGTAHCAGRVASRLDLFLPHIQNGTPPPGGVGLGEDGGDGHVAP